MFVTAAQQFGVDVTAAVVVGDSVWDLLAAHRARARRRAALRRVRTGRARAGWRVSVYQDPADLLRHLDEVGVRTSE
jgi:phosphoglycolate phosphatase-like HAD superfamily hydrolase